MNWTVQYAEYYLYRGVSRTNAYEFMQQSGRDVPVPHVLLVDGVEGDLLQWESCLNQTNFT